MFYNLLLIIVAINVLIIDIVFLIYFLKINKAMHSDFSIEEDWLNDILA